MAELHRRHHIDELAIAEQLGARRITRGVSDTPPPWVRLPAIIGAGQTVMSAGGMPTRSTLAAETLA